MPKKPKKPCAYPGCPNLTEKTYCEDHAAKQRRNYDIYSRDPNVNKIYGRRWRKLRDLYISHHPICEMCEKHGQITPVDEVHHIIPVNKGGKNEWNNLMSLCKSCHQKIHIELGDRG